MVILKRKYTWSNLLGLLLKASLVWFVSYAALYGLKQSPCVWFGKLNNIDQSFGLKRNEVDHSASYCHTYLEKCVCNSVC